MRAPTSFLRLAASSFRILLFVSSLGASVFVGALALASHTPFEQNDIRVQQITTDVAPEHGRWAALHVLAAGCACSRAVAEHLVARGPFAGVNETILLVGSDALLGNRLQRAGFSVHATAPEQAVQRYNLHGAPCLLFVDPSGRVRYSGGYSDHRGATDKFQDVLLWREVSSGGTPTPLPVFGCAVGHALQSRIDPLGLKYSARSGT